MRARQRTTDIAKYSRLLAPGPSWPRLGPRLPGLPLAVDREHKDMGDYCPAEPGRERSERPFLSHAGEASGLSNGEQSGQST